MVEDVKSDLLPVVAKDPNIKMFDQNPLGNQYVLRFNTIHKPFDDPKVRQAMFYALNQEDFLKAVHGDAKYYKLCKALFICGTPLATDKGMDGKLESNFKKSRELLAEAKYDGTPVVLLHSTDLAVLTNLAPVAKSLMERGGFKVDMQSMDWQSVVARRAKKDAPNAGGWNAFLTSWVAADVLNPVGTAFLNSSCEKALFGWPCDPEMEKLRDAVRARDRPGQAEGHRRAGAAALPGSADARAPGPVVPADGAAQERRRPADRAGGGVLERREEVPRTQGPLAGAPRPRFHDR